MTATVASTARRPVDEAGTALPCSSRRKPVQRLRSRGTHDQGQNRVPAGCTGDNLRDVLLISTTPADVARPGIWLRWLAKGWCANAQARVVIFAIERRRPATAAWCAAPSPLKRRAGGVFV